MNENWLDKHEIRELSKIVRQLDGSELKNSQENIYHELKVLLDNRRRNVEISKEIVDVLESVMGKVYEEKNGGSSYGKKKKSDGIIFVRFNMSNNDWTYDPIRFKGITYHEPFVDSMNKNASKILDKLSLGINPPDDIIVKDKLNASKSLKSIKLYKKITKTVEKK